MRHLEPDPVRRARMLPWFMGVGLRYAALHGEAWCVGEPAGAAALWISPEHPRATPGGLLRAGFAAAPGRLGWRAFCRLNRVMAAFEHAHHRAVPEPHWYLLMVGTEPARQGQGLASTVLAPRLAQADAAGLPCYLETASRDNVRYYERRGFRTVAEGALPGGGPHFWGMKRQA